MTKDKYADFEQDGTVECEGKTYDRLVKKNAAGIITNVALVEAKGEKKTKPSGFSSKKSINNK